MNDSELCKMFGTTVEQVEVDCEKYESGDFSGWELGEPIDGRPKAPMNTADDKTYTVSSREVIYKGACNDVEIDGKCYGLYRFELSAFGNFSAYTDNGGSVWLPAAFCDFDLKNAAQLKEVLEEVRSEWWQDWQSDDEFDQIIYKLFAAEC